MKPSLSSDWQIVILVKSILSFDWQSTYKEVVGTFDYLIIEKLILLLKVFTDSLTTYGTLTALHTTDWLGFVNLINKPELSIWQQEGIRQFFSSVDINEADLISQLVADQPHRIQPASLSLSLICIRIVQYFMYVP